MIQLFQIIVLIFSAIIHEYMHGWMAERLGDDTAKRAGRLTLNPLAHLDWFGSVLLPLMLIFSGVGVIFGWAKPVPYNPNNLRNPRWDSAKVAAAGPLGNLIIAVLFGLFLRFVPLDSLMLVVLIVIIVFINLILMIFNLVPIPPLDGSKILMAFLPSSWQVKFMRWERYGIILLLLFIFIAIDIILPITLFLMKLIIGNEAFASVGMIFSF